MNVIKLSFVKGTLCILLSSIATACFSGCGASPLPGGSNVSGFVSSSDPGAEAFLRGADSFTKIIVLDLIDGISMTAGGRIDSPGEVVAYDIGQVFPGDRLVVEVIAMREGFDPAVVVLDGNLNWMHLNDDRNYYKRETDPYAAFVSRKSTDRCYIAVSSSVRSDTTGEYTLHVTRTPNVAYNPPAAQTVYLNFRGDSQVVIGRRSPVNVPVFSGAMISPEFAPYTADLVRKTVERVRRDYLGYNVTIIASHEQNPPGGPHTTVYFGSYNPSLLGIADSVDTFNQRPVQEAIIFVDTFRAFLSQDPTVDEMANALGNVASHEIGHLLGLNHTTDTKGIMDTTAGLRQMLVPQSFRRAPLNSDTFTVGYQNSPELLLQNVGGNPAIIEAAKRVLRAEYRDPWYDEGPQDPARSYTHFGTGCGLHE